jgi:esterase/lipase superfamily enzyme
MTLALPGRAAAQAAGSDSAFVADSIALARGLADVQGDSAADRSRRHDEAVRLLQAPVIFQPGGVTLDSVARDLVIRKAWYLYVNRDLTVRLTAYGDAGLGSTAAAVEQARARVDAVRALLKERAIAEARIAVDEAAGPPADGLAGVAFVVGGDPVALDTPPADASPPPAEMGGAHLVAPAGGRRYGWGTVRIYYATDRAATGKSDVEDFYGADRSGDGSLSLGRVEVSIPRVHRRGFVERPAWYRIDRTANPDRHLLVRAIVPLAEAALLDSVRATVAGSGSKEALVFIHGYNVTFHEAALRTAQLTYDLGFDGAPILYSWPSKGSLFRYAADREAAEWSAVHLRRFLDSSLAITGANHLNVIAHSMGNRVLTLALEQMSQSPKGTSFSNLVLAAPDVDAERFDQQMVDEIRPLTSRLTIYMSARDKALRVSRLLSTNRRLGEATDPILVVRTTDTIDASDVDTDLLGHGYIASNRDVIDDLVLLLEKKSPPPRARLVQAARAGAIYWRLPVSATP